MSRDRLSKDSIHDASQSRVDYSGHGDAAGASGERPDQNVRADEYLRKRGQTKLVAPPKDGFKTVTAGLAWNNIVTQQAEGLINRMMKKVTKAGVDLDLGCLYELKNGKRGCIQAFGELFGDLEQAPFIALSGDERTGDSEGDDEVLSVNGGKWPEINKLLVYAYIYDGPTCWSEIAPDLTLHVMEEEPDIHITIDAKLQDMNLCAMVMIENKKDGIAITNMSEYFPSHPAMDRAYGFGLKWEDGEKA